MDNVIDLLKQKIAADVYEPSDTSYRSRWFCVKKKNRSLRIMHDLQPLNAVTVTFPLNVSLDVGFDARDTT